MKTTEGGRVIAIIKAKLALTNQTIADDYGVHVNTVSGWISGKNRPHYDDIVQIVDMYSQDLNDLREIIKHESIKL
ncbi:helix-turn-helix domain-containing protein [Glaciecola siphonariae]|uniref:Helix-turn-helix domain-containing protein n=1 Tax=Glaciecola siphonariae TaxID=521012 RepID=A0ABV9LUQ0_9ALTE